MRYGLVCMGIFLLAGAILIFSVDMEKAREQAIGESSSATSNVEISEINEDDKENSIK